MQIWLQTMDEQMNILDYDAVNLTVLVMSQFWYNHINNTA